MIQKIFHRNYLTLLFFTGLILFLISACSSKLKKIRNYDRINDYANVLSPEFDCNKNTPECFKIKVIRANSFFETGDLTNATLNVQEALKLRSSRIKNIDLTEAYLLQIKIFYELLQKATYFEQKHAILEKMETHIQLAKTINQKTEDRILKLKYQKNLDLLHAETLLDLLDFTAQDSLNPVYEKMLKVSERLDQYYSGNGLARYYSLYGKLKITLPAIERLFNEGEGNFDKFLFELKSIYQESIKLRNMPIYSDGYRKKIDDFLAVLVDNIKRLVL